MTKNSPQSEAVTKRESPAASRVMGNALLRMALLGLFPLSDPFDNAARRIDHPGGLLGKLLPYCLPRVEQFIGKARAEWSPSEFNRALEFMGFWIDSLAERTELQNALLIAQNAPKKRGRKSTRIPKLGAGLLGAPPQSKGGRPVTWSPNTLKGIVDKIDKIKAEFSLKQDSKAIQKLIELWAAGEGITPQALKRRHQRVEKCSLDGTLRNLVSRGRKALSKLPEKLP